jgi:hypothetical protein
MFAHLQAAQALSEMQEREVIARSAAAADSAAAQALEAGGAGSSMADMQGLTEEDQMAMLTAMGILEAQPQQEPQQRQRQTRGRPQVVQQQQPASPVRAKPTVFSTSPPQNQRTPVPVAPGPAHYFAGRGYAVPPPPPPPQRAALVQDFVNMEAQRAAAAAAK